MFLKNEGRIIALVMIRGLALMIYSLAEHELRAALAETGETLPDQRKKPTKSPTIRRVFKVFEGITVLCYRLKEGEDTEYNATTC